MSPLPCQKVCGGTREAFRIRRTLFARQCSRSCEIVLSVWGYQSSTPYPQTRRPHRKPSCVISFRALPAIGVNIKKLILATFVITACYADLRPGSEFELLLGTFVIAACHADLHQNGDFWLLLATSVITTCYTDLKPGVHQNIDLCLLLATFVICDHSLLFGTEAGGAKFSCCWQPPAPRPQNNAQKGP